MHASISIGYYEPTLRNLSYVRHFLSEFSRYHCAWYGVDYKYYVASLPSGLVFKWSDGASLDEAPASILMTRIPGYELSEVYEDLEETERESIVSELKLILETMCSWPNPTASSHSFRSPEEFDSIVATAKRMQDMPHPIVFTHGDFAMHNVLVHDGRVSGFID
ncbi:hypothetical protein DL768_009309 [Monosporascus sp. mg162]|nr:hypothetical protein DL768_009309 [Monosporascus sp. mg162]